MFNNHAIIILITGERDARQSIAGYSYHGATPYGNQRDAEKLGNKVPVSCKRNTPANLR